MEVRERRSERRGVCLERSQTRIRWSRERRHKHTVEGGSLLAVYDNNHNRLLSRAPLLLLSLTSSNAVRKLPDEERIYGRASRELRTTNAEGTRLTRIRLQSVVQSDVVVFFAVDEARDLTFGDSAWGYE